MPIINLKTSRTLTKSNKKTISGRLTEITSELLRKNSALTVVNIHDAVGSWFLNGEENGDAGTFQLSINITRGTNTQEEKENWLKSVWDYVQHTFSVGEDAVCYITINEIERSALTGRASRLRRSDGVHDLHTALYSAVC